MSRVVQDSPRDVSPSASAAAPLRTGRHANTTLVVILLALGGLAFAVLQSLVAPALPVLAKDLHASMGGISWVLTAYLLSASVLTPVLARLGDMVGKRRVLLIVLAVLAAGTLLAAVSSSLTLLIVARVFQGAAGALLPLSISIVRDELPREKVGVTVGILSAIFGVGGGLGIVLAGPIVDHLSWHWLFWFPLVLVAIAIAGTAFGVPESPVRTPGRIDLIGTTILSGGLVSLLLAVNKGSNWGWGGAATLSLFIAAVVLFVIFVRVELPAQTGYGFGKSVTGAGLFLLPAVGAMLVFAPISGLLAHRFGPKLPFVLGALVATIGFATTVFNHGTTASLMVCIVLNGAGLGLALAAMSNAIIEAVPRTHTGEATGVNAIVRTIGGSIGAAVMAAVLSSKITPQGLPLDGAFTEGFWVCAGVGVLAILAALILPSAHRRHQDAVALGVEDAPPEPEGIIHHRAPEPKIAAE